MTTYIARWKPHGGVSPRHANDVATIADSREEAIAKVLKMEPNVIGIETCEAAGPDDNGRFFWSRKGVQYHHQLPPDAEEGEYRKRMAIINRRAAAKDAIEAERFEPGDIVSFRYHVNIAPLYEEGRIYPNGTPDPYKEWKVVSFIDVPVEHIGNAYHTQWVKLAGHYNEKISGHYLRLIRRNTVTKAA